MRPLQNIATRIAVAGALMALAAQGVVGQIAYPSKPVKIVVGFPAGSAPDTLARLVANKLQLGQPVVVEGITGAGGNIAADRVAKAMADGYTLLLAGNASVVVNQSLYEKLPYDPEKDLVPISQIAATPNVLVVHPELPAKTVQELVALARAKPDALTYAHAGVGISQHLGAELFKQMAAIDIRAVGYRGGPALFADLMAGRIDMCFCNIVTTLPLVKEGKLRALAITSVRRSPLAPDLPTMMESGFAAFEAIAWFGLMAPRGTPVPIVEQLHRETARALADPELRKTFEALGMSAIGNSPAEFTASIKAEVPYWRALIKAIGVKVE